MKHSIKVKVVFKKGTTYTLQNGTMTVSAIKNVLFIKTHSSYGEPQKGFELDKMDIDEMDVSIERKKTPCLCIKNKEELGHTGNILRRDNRVVVLKDELVQEFLNTVIRKDFMGLESSPGDGVMKRRTNSFRENSKSGRRLESVRVKPAMYTRVRERNNRNEFDSFKIDIDSIVHPIGIVESDVKSEKISRVKTPTKQSNNPFGFDLNSTKLQSTYKFALENYGGLKNLGNTCYFNSVLQALFSLESFVKTMVYCDSILGLPDNFFKEMVVVSKEKSAKKKEINPRKLKMLLNRSSPPFNNTRQHDAHEFLLACLSILEEQIELDLYSLKLHQESIAPIRSPSEHPLLLSPVRRIFSFLMEISIICPRCSNILTVTEVFNDISLEINSEINLLSSLLDDFFKEEIIDYNCKCGGKVAKYTRKLLTIPKVLVIHLKRFQVIGDFSTKLEACVFSELNIDLSKYLSKNILPPIEDIDPVLLDYSKVISKNAGAKMKVDKNALDLLNRPFSMHKIPNEQLEKYTEDDLFSITIMKSLIETTSKENFLTEEKDCVSDIIDCSDSDSTISGEFAYQNSDSSDEFASEILPDEIQILKKSLIDEVQLLNSFEKLPKESVYTKYKKQAVVHHHGISSDSGHYTCQAFSSKKWKLFDDEKVTSSTSNSDEKTSYLYFYHIEPPEDTTT